MGAACCEVRVATPAQRGRYYQARLIASTFPRARRRRCPRTVTLSHRLRYPKYKSACISTSSYNYAMYVAATQPPPARMRMRRQHAHALPALCYATD